MIKKYYVARLQRTTTSHSLKYFCKSAAINLLLLDIFPCCNVESTSKLKVRHFKRYGGLINAKN